MTDTTGTAATAAAPEPKPGSPEYDAAMAAKFRESGSRNLVESPLAKTFGDKPVAEDKPAATDKQARPDNVPEKFWDAEKGAINTEALLKSYGELEKARSGKQPAAEETTDKVEIATEGAETETVATAGLDYAALNAKIVANGKLDEADYAALAKVGVAKEIADSHVELIAYKMANEAAKAVEYIGGQEAVDKLMKWAGANLPEAEKAEYNRLLAGPNWRVAVDALKAKQAGAKPTKDDPNLVANPGSSAPAAVGFATRADMTAAMQDPRYNDRTSVGEAYRAEVTRKVAVSPWRTK